MKVVTETVTVTEIVYIPDYTPVPPPPPPPVVIETTPEPTPTPKPTPIPQTTPKPTPTPEPTPTPYQPVPPPPPTTVEPVADTKPAPKPTPTPKPSSPPVGNSPSDDLTDFERMYVNKHNELRAKTGAGPLTFDRTMADYAQNHVNSCVFQHSSPHVYGENLGAGYDTVADSIEAWFDEWQKYPFDKPDFYSESGHFTQVVWKAAKKIGCAQKVCNGANGTPGIYYSCNYDEGNLIGSFGDNVSPPTGS